MVEKIILRNAGDVSDVRRGFLRESDVRQIITETMVDGAFQALFISESFRKKLGLNVLGNQIIKLANNSPRICQCTEPVEVHRKNGYILMQALVIQGVNDILLLAIPYERVNMDKEPEYYALTGIKKQCHSQKIYMG